MLKAIDKLDHEDLLDKVIGFYVDEDFNNIIILWENYGGRKLDLISSRDRQLGDALANSYLHKGLFDKSLFYVDQRIDFMKRDAGQEDKLNNDGANFDFYYKIKLNILIQKKEDLKTHSTLMEYFELGGKEEYLKNLLFSVREKIFNKYFFFVEVGYTVIYIAIIMLKHLKLIYFELTAYIVFLITGISFIFCLLFCKKQIQKITFSILGW